MSKKNKWKKQEVEGVVETFTAPDSLFNLMVEENADFKLLVRDMISGSKVMDDGNKALLDLIYKVKGFGKNPEAQKFWADRLEALMKVNGLNSQMRDRLLLIESEYRKVYQMNSDLLDRVKELEARLATYEKL